MTQEIIRAAFETRLKTWADAHSLTVAFENVDFDPPDEAYVRAWMLPAEPQSYGLDGKHRKYHGLFQVDLCMPLNEGGHPSQLLVESLDAAFPLTAPMSQSGLSIWITSPMAATPGKNEAKHYVTHVSCGYRTDVFV